MNVDLSRAIEEWFTKCEGDIEFVRCEQADGYIVSGPSNTPARSVYVYATKPSCVLKAKKNYVDFNAIGLICRTGLPNIDDMTWIRKVLEQHELMFLGDMDPGDLMVFAWLRAHLDRAQITYLGISDEYINHLGVELPEAYIMSCAPSEQASLAVLGTMVPDYRELVGPRCAGLLDKGQKIELEAIVSKIGPPGPILSPAFIKGM